MRHFVGNVEALEVKRTCTYWGKGVGTASLPWGFPAPPGGYPSSITHFAAETSQTVEYLHRVSITRADESINFGNYVVNLQLIQYQRWTDGGAYTREVTTPINVAYLGNPKVLFGSGFNPLGLGVGFPGVGGGFAPNIGTLVQDYFDWFGSRVAFLPTHNYQRTHAYSIGGTNYEGHLGLIVDGTAVTIEGWEHNLTLGDDYSGPARGFAEVFFGVGNGFAARLKVDAIDCDGEAVSGINVASRIPGYDAAAQTGPPTWPTVGEMWESLATPVDKLLEYPPVLLEFTRRYGGSQSITPPWPESLVEYTEDHRDSVEATLPHSGSGNDPVWKAVPAAYLELDGWENVDPLVTSGDWFPYLREIHKPWLALDDFPIVKIKQKNPRAIEFSGSWSLSSGDGEVQGNTLIVNSGTAIFTRSVLPHAWRPYRYLRIQATPDRNLDGISLTLSQQSGTAKRYAFSHAGGVAAVHVDLRDPDDVGGVPSANLPDIEMQRQRSLTGIDGRFGGVTHVTSMTLELPEGQYEIAAMDLVVRTEAFLEYASKIDSFDDGESPPFPSGSGVYTLIGVVDGAPAYHIRYTVAVSTRRKTRAFLEWCASHLNWELSDWMPDTSIPDTNLQIGVTFHDWAADDIAAFGSVGIGNSNLRDQLRMRPLADQSNPSGGLQRLDTLVGGALKGEVPLFLRHRQPFFAGEGALVKATPWSTVDVGVWRLWSFVGNRILGSTAPPGDATYNLERASPPIWALESWQTGAEGRAFHATLHHGFEKSVPVLSDEDVARVFTSSDEDFLRLYSIAGCYPYMAKITPQAGGVHSDGDDLGCNWLVAKQGDTIRVFRWNREDWADWRDVLTDPAAVNPKIAVTCRENILVVFDDGQDVYLTRSISQGDDWSTPVSIMAGTFPCPCSDRLAGIEYITAFDSGAWNVARKTPDDEVFTVVGTVTSEIPESSTGLHVDSGRSGALVFVGSDGANVRRWESLDQGETFREI